MSTETPAPAVTRGSAPRGSAPGTRRARSRRRRGRAFALAFTGVVGALLLVGIAGAAASTARGPRATDVQVDPAAAVAASGARLIITTSQALKDVTPEQVTITPATPFAVDTAGRSVGIRFANPLWDDTQYTIRIDDVQGVGGGPARTIEQTFRTAEAELFVLQRGDEQDTIFRTDLTGEDAVPVYRHPHIEDFRTTSSHLVVSVRGAAPSDERGSFGPAALVVTDLDGGDERTLPLPGEGSITNLQSADRGELVGYTFTDDSLGASGGRESMLFTTSLKDPDAEPVPIEVDGADSRVVQWRFVPDSGSVLFIGFDGTLWLTDAAAEGATSLGTALALDDVTASGAVVERAEGLVLLDLTTATDAPLVEPDTDAGQLRTVQAVPGGGTLRLSAPLDADGIPDGSVLSFVAEDGTSSVVATAPREDSVIRTCVSPSGRYALWVVAPDIIANPYDTYLLPMPKQSESHIVEIATGEPVVALSGFDSSWCRVPPQ
ncbi:hypothetical protein [Microbacterium sp. SS28]|uniref:hypothetical protein n=1 Tax=Microbacterium sp. SS28 TaxID=2919948 RepID=UPI001FAA4325|nr:hypothetical protein [Microbacterium sp. SS28]